MRKLPTLISRFGAILGPGLMLLCGTDHAALSKAEDAPRPGIDESLVNVPEPPTLTQSQAEAQRTGDAFITISDVFAESDEAQARPISFQDQPIPDTFPQQTMTPPSASGRSAAQSELFSLTRQAFGIGGATQANSSVVLGAESLPRVTSDSGSLLGKSPSAVGVYIQRRTPVVTDPRIRGSRVGQLAAAGSYWVPARIDLDTMLSKVDSRIVDYIQVFDGPYTARYGPGFHFIDVELLESPRFEYGPEYGGRTSLDYQTNGQQWHGRQTFWGGDEDTGFRVGYGHRHGEDFTTGAGQKVPGEYESRDWDVALGWDPTPDSRIEFSYLRLDQTDVDFPGQAFDMDFLVTDAYEVEYVEEGLASVDRFSTEVWYNRTRFTGNAQNEDKRAQFPFFDFQNLTMFTDVDSASTGYRAEAEWGEEDAEQLRLGTDLRHVKQELNEISTGGFGLNAFFDVNSPLPRSFNVNPGVYAELEAPWTDRFRTKLGARVDWSHANITDDPAKLAALGPTDPQATLAEILGTDEYDQNFLLWGLYLTSEYDLGRGWTIVTSGGHGERPPNLTELYVAQSFLFLLQNGQNTATGDPLLDPERMWQFDFGLKYDARPWRGGAKFFYAWVQDYITFENLRVVTGPPFGQVEQVQLKYVNTDLATLTGAELYGEVDATAWLTPFATLRMVQGVDRTRDGDFATRPVADGGVTVIPSERTAGLPRGFYSGIDGASEEPLPSIMPLEARLGLRFHEASDDPRWGAEFACRLADDQDRVAASLLETPTPGYAVYDMRAYYKPRPNVLLVAGIENIFDRNYREHLDFRQTFAGENLRAVFQPGASYYFGGEITY
jgi:iron complex outermembrane receptor protein